MAEAQIIQAILDNQQGIDKNREEIRNNHKAISILQENMDEVVTILRRLDTERLSLVDWQQKQDQRLVTLETKLV